MARIGLALVALFCCSAAFASGVWNAVTVLQVQATIGASANLQVELSSNAIGTPPACSSPYRNWITVDMSTIYGAMLGQILQTARLSGSTVNLQGTGSCSIIASVENVSWVQE